MSPMSAFGDLLRQYRARKAGLSQTRLAELAGYDRAILGRMAQGGKDLTGPSGRERVIRLITVLHGEGALLTLGEANGLLAAAHMHPLFAGQTDEAVLMRLLIPAKGHGNVQPAPGQAPIRHNLPAWLSPFIGREREVAEVKQLLALDGTRLITLTGAGGCGKTRLALQCAASFVESTSMSPLPSPQWSDGVWLVEFAPLADPGLIADVVLGAFQLPASSPPAIGRLIDFLRSRQLLLILDNCEHLIDAVATFTLEVLRACPYLTVVATSREALNVDGERAWRVPPMQPDQAARLFVERAQAARSDLTLDARDVTVAHICQRLDGMPLAIELAAARLHGLSLNELAARLDDRFGLLTAGQRGALRRHQTLRAVIDWSFDLLSEPERILFRRLGIFAGGWTAELAEEVCADAPHPGPLPSGERVWERGEILPLLLSLVSKSLVTAEEHDGETRYRYLETIRAYALAKLTEHGELEMMHRRHAESFAAFAERSYQPLRGPGQRCWMARLEQDYPNLHAALVSSFGPAGDVQVGCRIFGNLRVFWWSGSHVSDSQRWAALARAALTEQMPPGLQGAVWLTYTRIVPSLTFEDKQTGYRQSLACYTAASDPSGISDAMEHVGATLLDRDPHDPQGSRMIEDSVALARSVGDAWSEHRSLMTLGHFAQMNHEYERAERLYQENLRSCRVTGDLANLARMLAHFIWLHMERLEFDKALTSAQEMADVARQIGDLTVEFRAASSVAEATRYLGDASRAVILAEANLAQARDKLPPLDHEYELAVLVLSKALNDVGQHERAQALLVEWIRTLQQNGGCRLYWDWHGKTMDVLGCVASGSGNSLRAARLFGVADRIFENGIERRSANHEWEYAPYIAMARSALGDAPYEVAHAEGHAMTPEEAVEYALGVESHDIGRHM